MLRRGGMLAALLILCAEASSQAAPDPDFDTSVADPVYRTSHPRVVIDEAHFNYHTSTGRYRPFAELLRHDGYDVSAGTQRLTPAYLADIEVLVIANARGADGPPRAPSDAFTAAECMAVGDWVRHGGALLLIADHAPFGAAAQSLGATFGVAMGRGHVFDPEHSTDDASFLLFRTGSLGKHRCSGRGPTP